MVPYASTSQVLRLQACATSPVGERSINEGNGIFTNSVSVLYKREKAVVRKKMRKGNAFLDSFFLIRTLKFSLLKRNFELL